MYRGRDCRTAGWKNGQLGCVKQPLAFSVGHRTEAVGKVGCIGVIILVERKGCIAIIIVAE